MSARRIDSKGKSGMRSLDWKRVQHLRAVVPQHVVYRALPSETVLLNIHTGTYLGMDEIGSRCFEVLRDSDDLASALQILVEEYEAPEERIRKDLVGYCAQLLSNGLIELEEPDS